MGTLLNLSVELQEAIAEHLDCRSTGRLVLVNRVLRARLQSLLYKRYSATALTRAIESDDAVLIGRIQHYVGPPRLLHLAACGGYKGIVYELLHDGVDPNCILHDTTPLLLAAHAGHGDVVEVLLEAGADLHFAFPSGPTALYLAAGCGHLQATVHLLARGANPNASINAAGWTPLLCAIRNGRQEVAVMLIGIGGDIKSALSDGSTALSLAAMSGHNLIAAYLLFHGAEPNGVDKLQRWTPLHWAAHNGHHFMVRLLLRHGADLEATTSEGSKALLLAAQQGSADMVQNLLLAGANIHTTDNDGWSPAHTAACYGHLEVLWRLFKMGADFDCLTLDGATPLSIAAQYGALDSVRFILDIGAGESGKSHPQDWTPLHYAANEGELNVVRYLVCQEGFQPDLAPPDGTTALSLASEEGHIDTVLFLLDSGANPNAKSGLESWTPLHCAACNGHVSVVQLLRERGADSGLRTANGSTAADLATEGGHSTAAKPLL